MNKKIIAFGMACVLSMGFGTQVFAAETMTPPATTNNTILSTSQIRFELSKLGYIPVSDTYINNMIISSKSSRIATRSTGLPYSGGVAFGDTATYALSPVFEVSGQLSNTKQVLIYWTKNSGYKKISATSYIYIYIYIPSVGWYASTTKTTSYSPATIIGASTINSSITKFYVQFDRDDSKYATDFEYTLSIANYPLT